MGPCCVEGCTGVKEDTVFFEFPMSRGLRRKWLEMIKLPSKVPLGTVVCSQHFNPKDYEIVRGKVRLKRKVVPTLKLYNIPKKQSPSPETKPPTETELPVEKITESAEILPQPDSTTGNTEKISDVPVNSPEKERVEVESKEVSGSTKEICNKIVSKAIETVKPIIDSAPPLPDLKQPADFEEMITNYQIKNNKPNCLIPQTIEIEVPRDETIELDGRGDKPPVFIEISVDKDNSTAEASSQDCLMVLESVQVDVDPATLLLSERDYDDDEDLEFEVPLNNGPSDKKQDPISLLTSSDEDDVIIQEPQIDTVEVSDETDEDDMPLVKLLKKKPAKKKTPKKRPKKLPDKPEAFSKLIWTGVYEFYCVQCQFKTFDSMEYAAHLKHHEKLIQVCHVCNYTSASKTQFSRHVRKHKDEKKFKCHLCEYKARHEMSLIYHMECHEKDTDKVISVKKGFKCKKCGFRANLKSIVLKHVTVCGSDVKMFSCDLCEYATKRKPDLRRHMNSIHKGAEVVDIVDSDVSIKSNWD